jgi:hypothetical protein
MAWLGGNGALLAADEAGMVDQLQSNVEAMQLCTAYYISHAYTEVRTASRSSREKISQGIMSPHWPHKRAGLLCIQQTSCAGLRFRGLTLVDWQHQWQSPRIVRSLDIVHQVHTCEEHNVLQTAHVLNCPDLCFGGFLQGC